MERTDAGNFYWVAEKEGGGKEKEEEEVWGERSVGPE